MNSQRVAHIAATAAVLDGCNVAMCILSSPLFHALAQTSLAELLGAEHKSLKDA